MADEFYYKIKIKYQGTSYFGWQVQKGPGKTVQGELNNALRVLAKSPAVRTIGSGRTDSGVHALGQVLKATIPIEIPCEGLLKGLNSLLPNDVQISSVQNSDRNFHPIRDSVWKEYLYIFSCEDVLSPFSSPLMTHYPFLLDINLMKKGAELFIGEHDFCNYYCEGTDVLTTIRTIFECDLSHYNSQHFWGNFSSDYYIFRVKGSGFLKQMVRLMMGSLWALGRGKISLEDLKNSLNSPKGEKIGATAPPQGLYLNKVHYLD